MGEVDVIEIDLNELLKILKFAKEKTQMGAKDFLIYVDLPFKIRIEAHDKYDNYLGIMKNNEENKKIIVRK